MRDFHWLHFSDLHLDPDANFNNAHARQQLLDFLEEEVSCGRLHCDYIFLTGDIAHKNNYDGVQEYIGKLFEKLNWSLDRYNNFFWASGNHDISRKSKLRKLVITKGLRESDNQSQTFEDWMRDPEFRELLVSKGMCDYIAWHKNILGRAPHCESNYPHTKHVFPNLNLIVLNTCLTSCDDEDEYKLHIIESKLLNLFDGLNLSNPVFVIGHHGQEFFQESERKRLGSLFDSGNVAIYLCGHSHELGYSEFKHTGWDLPQITCGTITDGDAKPSFMHGSYKSKTNEVMIIPYSYGEEKGEWNWRIDDNLDRRLNGCTSIDLTNVKRIHPETRHSVSSVTGKNSENELPERNSNTNGIDWATKFFASSSTKVGENV